MELKICRKCRRMYQSVTNKAFCPACMEEDEKMFQKVKSYIWDHAGCSAIEVANECGCSEQQIKEWLRENRIQFGSGASLELECMQCGVPIAGGRFCARCLEQMNQAASELRDKVNADHKPTAAPSSQTTKSRGVSYHTEFGR